VTIDGANFERDQCAVFGEERGFHGDSGHADSGDRAVRGDQRADSRVESGGSGASAEEVHGDGSGADHRFFEPPIGLAGTEVFIQGANFTNVTAVRFNTVNATTFAAPAHTQLRAVVPNGATSGKIVVTTPGGP
jgi:hypothetical protein